MPKIKSYGDKADKLPKTKKNIDNNLNSLSVQNKGCDHSKIELQSKVNNEFKNGATSEIKNKVGDTDAGLLEQKINRRDFMVLTATSMAGVGVACSLWPLVDSLNPAADVLASSSIEVEIDKIQAGQTAVVSWRGKPVFIKHRTAEEIDKARKVSLTELTDPEEDQSRVKEGHDQWLVVVGICTHLGCIPIDNKGDYDGWFCPCHGSHYDTSGRIRKGPAPKNLEVPQYQFISDQKIRIG